MAKNLKIEVNSFVVFILVAVFSLVSAGWLSARRMSVPVMWLVLFEEIFFIYFLYKSSEKVIQNEATLEIKVKERVRYLEKFKLAMDSTSDQIIITDVDGIVLYINRATEKTTGYTMAEAAGKKVGRLWGKQMEKGFYENLWKTIKTEVKPFVAELRNRRKNGEEYVIMLNIDPVLDETGKLLVFFVGIERDITKAKETDRVKTDFISFASHQLRTPLTVINWNTDMLLNGDAGEITAEQKQYLAEIKRGEKRMEHMINSLLNISRLEDKRIKIQPEPTDIFGVISSAISELSILKNNKNCAIKFDQPDQIPPPIALDPVLLRQIIVNLLTNAVNYSQPDKCSIHVYFKEMKDCYQIDVADKGIGIPFAVQGKVFEKFFRADNATQLNTEGTGLGLYMTKLLIEIAGGKIWFDSTEGKGTTFHFTIPKSGMKKIIGEKSLVV